MVQRSKYFLGLNLKDDLKSEIETWRGKQLPDTYRSVAANNFHITLVFLGFVDKKTIESSINAISQINANPFSLTLNHLDCWPKPQVLFLGAGSIPAQLQNLVDQLEKVALKNLIAIEQRQYVPHLTLCRKAKTLPSIKAEPHFFIRFTNFCLFESVSTNNGVKYKVIKSWPLQQYNN